MNKLRLITTPYSFNGKLFEAYDDIFSMVNDDDWACFLDGDTAFLEMANFGHLLQEYIDLYPTTGMFTCYATRCHYEEQRRKNVDPKQDSIKYFAKKVLEVKELHPKTKPMNRRVAGHLLMLKKATWAKELIAEIKKYNPGDGDYLRVWAEENHDIKKQVKKYLEYA
jgi:hypothetical protein